MAAMKETLGFQTEVKQLLHLMIHALYSNKEIFLRELISNASDAADKLRFESLREPMLLVGDPDLKVWVSFDKEAHTITVRDNGIGMTRDEAIQNLGTIAKSGTKEFLASLTGDKAKDSKLIGQFGVGFYSVFMVADKVQVTTLRAGKEASQAVRWTSTGEGDYTIESVDYDKRGTEVVLYLKKDEEELLNDWRLRHIITKYSDHLTLPVIMKNEKGEEEVVNRATALWTLPKQEITDEQYKELYKHIAHDFEDPLFWTHNKVEGKLEYIALLYIPARASFDLFQHGKIRGLKLYIKRVFIMDDAEQFLPHYLRFVRGIIDSNDLPLNISREMLQTNRIIDSIRTYVVKRVLSMLETLSSDDKEKYEKFWKEFGQVLKEGPGEDFGNKEQIAKLLRFASTHLNTEQQVVSLDDYISRMKANQTKIYYIASETFNSAKNSPHLEIFREQDIEVLLLSDRVDEWLMSHLTEYQGKPLQSIARGSLDIPDIKKTESEEKKTEKMFEEAEKEYEGVLQKMKDVLKDSVKDLRLSKRLTRSPSCIVVDEKELSMQMERMLKAAGQKLPEHKPILELNPTHPLMRQLKTETNPARFEDLSRLLLEEAILSEGGQLDDPSGFVVRLNSLLVG